MKTAPILLLASAAIAAPVSASVVIQECYSQVHAAPWYDDQGNGGAKGDFWANNFSASVDAAFSQDGYSGMGSANLSVLFEPPSPGLGGSFKSVNTTAMGFGSIVDGNPEHGDETAVGTAQVWMRILVTEPTPWTWTARVDGVSDAHPSGDARAVFEIENVVNDVHIAAYGTKVFGEDVHLEGVLQPGTYDVLWYTWGQIFNKHDGDPWIESAHAFAQMTGTFTVPSPGTALPLVATLSFQRRRNRSR